MNSEPKTYELLARIGAGGMSEVFLARVPGAEGFERRVVVKRLLPRFREVPEIVQMFVREAKLAAELRHPNIVQVYDLERTASGELYIVMEYVDGVDLRELIKSARRRNITLPAWLCVHVISEVLDGLAVLHALVDDSGHPRNVVHRDVSPDNIFISSFGDVKLGDLGVAKDDLWGREPYAEHAKGKYPFMSPEALLGKPIDARADIFAAGVVLWESLTGRSLFRAATPIETARNICGAFRVPPSRYALGIPPSLDRLVLATLDVDPDRRPRTARELQAQLLGILPRLHSRASPLFVRRTLESFIAGARGLEVSNPPEPVGVAGGANAVEHAVGACALGGSGGASSVGQAGGASSVGQAGGASSLGLLRGADSVLAHGRGDDGGAGRESSVDRTPVLLSTGESAFAITEDLDDSTHGGAVLEPIEDETLVAVAFEAVEDDAVTRAVIEADEDDTFSGGAIEMGSRTDEPASKRIDGIDGMYALHPQGANARSGIEVASPDGIASVSEDLPVVPTQPIGEGSLRTRPAAKTDELPVVPTQPIGEGSPRARPGVETDDLMLGLAVDLPIPIAKGNKETADIVHGRLPSRARGRVPWKPRSSSGEIQTPRTSSRWAPYEGPDAFWVRGRGFDFGPCSLTDLMLIVRSRLEPETRGSMELSGDRVRWTPLSEFLRLVSHDERSRAPGPRELEASLPISLFGEIWEQRMTGIVTVLHRSPDFATGPHGGGAEGSWTEVYVLQGRPTHVVSSEASLETLGQLLVHNLIEGDQLARTVHHVLLEGVPLVEILRSLAGVDIQRHRARFMVERLEPLMAWEIGLARFFPVAPEHRTPFASSLVALLPRLIESTWTSEALRLELAVPLDLALERTERFDRLLPELGLSETQLSAVHPFGRTRTLRDAIRASSGGERFGLILGRLLLGLGMLRPRVSVLPR